MHTSTVICPAWTISLGLLLTRKIKLPGHFSVWFNSLSQKLPVNSLCCSKPALLFFILSLEIVATSYLISLVTVRKGIEYSLAQICRAITELHNEQFQNIISLCHHRIFFPQFSHKNLPTANCFYTLPFVPTQVPEYLIAMWPDPSVCCSCFVTPPVATNLKLAL